MNAVLAAMMPWVHAIGWSLLHSLWQGALIGVGYAAIRHLVPQAQARVRYASGLVALSLLAIFPILTLWLLWPAMGAALDAVDMMEAGDGALSLSAAVDAVSTGGDLSSLLPALVLLWMLGVAISFHRAVHQWRGLERIVLQYSEFKPELNHLLRQVAGVFGDFARVRVLVSSRIDTPTLIGWVKPVILLPTAVALGFPRHQLELILAHELGHLRRHDHLVNLAQVVVETVLFYHPVVHWISREVRHEREVCCDQLVLRVTDGHPSEYARTLAALENLRQKAPQLAVAATGGMLVDRVRRILGLPHAGQATAGTGTGFVRLAIAVVAIVCLLGVSTQFDRIGVEGAAAEVVQVPRPPSVLRFAPELSIVSLVAPDFASLPEVLLHPQREEIVPAGKDRVGSQPAGVLVASNDREVSTTVAPSPVAPLDQVGRLDSAAVATGAEVAIIMPADTTASTEAIEASVPGVGVPERAAPLQGKSSYGAPVLLHRVAPVYPSANLSRSKGHVEFEFAIDRKGRVSDISVISGDSMGAFAEAARRALRQWRFEPLRSGSETRRFQQDFVFIDRPLVNADGDDGRCVRSTGSHICRPVRISDAARSSAEVVPTPAALAMKGD